MIARALMSFPLFARLVRVLAGVEHRPAPTRSFRERVAERADEIQKRDGIAAINALAAAEATMLAEDYRLRFDSIDYDGDRLLWTAVYESGPVRTPTMIRLPLELATEATQMGVGSLN